MKKDFEYILENSLKEQVLNEAPTYFDNGEQGTKELLAGLITVTLENAFLPEITTVQKINAPSGVIYGLGAEQQTGPKRIIGVGSTNSDVNYSQKGVAANLILDFDDTITPVTVDDGAGGDIPLAVVYTGLDGTTKTITDTFTAVIAGTGEDVYDSTKAVLVGLGFSQTGMTIDGLTITYDDTNFVITFASLYPGKVSLVVSYDGTAVTDVNKADYGISAFTFRDGTEIVDITPKLIGRPYQVKSKKLKVDFTKELIDDFKAVTKEETAGSFAGAVASLLNFEIEQDAVAKIKAAHTAGQTQTDTHTWSVAANENPRNPANRLYAKIIKMLTTIGTAARTGIGNFIIVPPKFMQAVVLMEEFEGSVTDYYSVMQKVGVLNKFIKVFVNPAETEDKIICGFTPASGSKFMPGLIFAPYSFTVYSATNVDNLNLNQAIFARYALEFLESKTLTGTTDASGQKQYGIITVSGASTNLY